MRAERSSTIGTERLTNYALQIRSREDFIRELTSNLPARPEYFLQDAEMNREGAMALGELPPLEAMSPAEVKAAVSAGAMALDVRPGDRFADAHVPGSINIALSGQFATWAGTVLGLSAQPILIADTPGQIEEARVRLARVGIEHLRGFLAGGMGAWRGIGFAVGKMPQTTVEELRNRVASNGLRIIDVRRRGEWDAGHIAGAEHWPLDGFKTALPGGDATAPVAVHCKSGYRSMIACSLLRRAGFTDVTNVIGGFDAWLQAQMQIEKESVAR
jgi:rhodanese-related sulfurtransferase